MLWNAFVCIPFNLILVCRNYKVKTVFANSTGSGVKKVFLRFQSDAFIEMII